MKPSAVAVARPVRTIAEFSGVEPAGRSPTSSFTTVIVPGVPHALILLGDRRIDRLLEAARRPRRAMPGSDDRMSTSIQPSNGIEFTEVPPPTRPTLNVVFGCCGTCISSIFAIARPIAPIGFAQAERAEAVAAWSLERHAIAVAADGDVRHVDAGAVDRHEGVDLTLQACR